MTKEEIIDDICNRVEKSHILTRSELIKECAKHDLDWFDDILSGMEWNCCDRCGTLYPSEMLYWENCDWGYECEELEKGIQEEGVDYCALCENCVAELKKKGKQ